MTHDFDTRIERRGTGSLKWNNYDGKDIIPLWVADMDFSAPDVVIDALHRRVDHGVFGYTMAPPELVTTVREMLVRKYDWQVASEDIVWLPGLVTGFNLACRTTAPRAVMTAAPVYPPFFSAPGHFDCELERVDLVERNGRLVMDIEAMEKARTPRTGLFLFCNPHNPVGRVYSRRELEQFGEFSLAHDLTVCSDEIHCDLVLDEDKKHIPLASISPELAERTITLMAPSKTYNIPGLSCSFAVIQNPDLRERYLKSWEGIVPFVNTLGYTAALAAYRDADPWLNDLLSYLRTNRDLVEDFVRRTPDISMPHVEATYLAWIDMRHTGISDPARFFEHHGLGLSDGAAFGAPGFVRLNFGCPRSLLEEALERMGKALRER